MTVPKFGKAFRSEFSFHPNYVPLNHGSYGTYPKALKPILQGYQEAAEEHPDRWLRYEQHPVLEKNLKLVGQMINADSKDLAFLPSASQGANNVLRSFPFKAGDKILYVSTVYRSLLDPCTQSNTTLCIASNRLHQCQQDVGICSGSVRRGTDSS